MDWKDALQRVANSLGYEIRRLDPTPRQVVYASLSPMVERLLLVESEPFFVNVGAYDGVVGDPLTPFVLQYHWSGIMLEPQEEPYQRLVWNMRKEPQVRCLNSALGPDRHITLWCVTPSHRRPSAKYESSASSNKKAMMRDLALSERELTPVVVPSMSVSEFLQRHSVRRVDVLKVDTEGEDSEIVRQFLGNNVFPYLLMFESFLLDHADRRLLFQELDAAGYTLSHVERDTIGWRRWT